MPKMQTVSDKTEKLIIRLKDVMRIYKVGVECIHALDGIDLELCENEYVAVMGASGSGKSTLVSQILLRALKRRLYRSREKPGRHRIVLGKSWAGRPYNT